MSDADTDTEAELSFFTAKDRRRREAREKLVATIASWAQSAGLTEWGDHKAIAAEFPKVPAYFIDEALLAISAEEDNAFLDGLADTIEGEVIKRAIGGRGE